MQGRNVLKCFFPEFYALLAMSCSLTIRHAQQQEACLYGRKLITAYMAL